MCFEARANRYDAMHYQRCGKSGVMLPRMALGLWQNFGATADYNDAKKMVLYAFDHGICHVDLANNYGPPPGAAESFFGRVLATDLKAYRDELFISTKAGYHMWPGPYGEGGSKKHLLSSLDQSLLRLGIDYVDLFYHHRPDPDTPIEKTADALCEAVRQGKALYIGLSNYSPKQTQKMADCLKRQGVHVLAHQFAYNLLLRKNEPLFGLANKRGIGTIVYSPLAQGLLTDRYFDGIPPDSRAGRNSPFLTKKDISSEKQALLRALGQKAEARGQRLSQMALSFVLMKATSVLIGASRIEQIEQNIKTLEQAPLTQDELTAIEAIIKSGATN